MLEIIHSNYWPFIVLAVSMALIIVQITVLRIHPFLALFIAAITAGLDGREIGRRTREEPPDPSRRTDDERIWKSLRHHRHFHCACLDHQANVSWKAARRTKSCGALLASPATSASGWHRLWSTYILSVPIFFDTMFMLMVPLAKALRLRSGKDYLRYIMAICCGGVITHSMTVPHPGPIAMVDALKVDVGNRFSPASLSESSRPLSAGSFANG